MNFFLIFIGTCIFTFGTAYAARSVRADNPIGAFHASVLTGVGAVIFALAFGG